MIRLNICLLLLLIHSASIFANDVYFHRLGNKDELPQLNIYSIYQDETGAMWFGTTEGLCRYNGKETQIFTSDAKEPFTQNAIHSIFGNRKGAIYLLAEDDLLKYDLINEEFECLKKSGVREITYKNGFLWFAENYDVYQYQEKEGRVLKYTSIESNLDRITALTITNDSCIWIGRRNGLTLCTSNDPQTHRDVLAGQHVRSILVDSKQRVWATTNDYGLFQFDTQGNLINHYVHIPGKNSLSNNQVRTVLEDDSGKLWIGTFFGLNCFDPDTGVWTNYVHDDNQPHSLSHSSVFALYKDIQGTLWIGTYFGGVNYFNPQSDIFRFYNASSHGPNNLSFPFVGNMVEDGHGKLWICTEGGGLNCLDLSTRQFSRYLYEGYDLESVLKYNLKSIWHHKEKDRLYLGVHNGGLGVFDMRNKKFRILKETTKLSIAGNSVREMQYHNNELIFLNAIGIHRLDIETEKVHPFRENEELTRYINQGFIYHFHIDRHDRLWLASQSLFCVDFKTNKFRQYKYDEDNPRSIGKFKVTAICETKNGDMFFGTAGSGMFKYNSETDDFENYTEDNKKAISNFCYHIAETNNGNLILLHNNGMAIFDPPTATVIYKSPTNFPITGFFEGNTSYITSNNEIFVGGTNGMVSFYESELINQKALDYSLFFDKLFVNNKRIVPHDNSGILDKSLPFCEKIRLKHNQNNISVQFASSNYSQDAIQNYEYKLEDFDKDWNTTSANMLVYTNLNPGKYKLIIREIQSQNNQPKSHSLYIQIDTPFYKSTTAYIIYLLLFIGAIVGVVRFFVWRSQLNAVIEIERTAKEQNEKLNQMKLRFFTNISHELRTPLTLIIAQTELLLSRKLDEPVRRKNLSILKNANHMRNLISELLYFRKLEQGFYKLRVQQTDLIGYVKSLYESFQDYAIKRNIKYNFVHPQAEVQVYIDPVQFAKSIYNLLSNAFKYTSDGGEITIGLKTDGQFASIFIEDNGIGIPADKLADIFTRFYQVEYRVSGFSLGTGIGLALAKEIVESHHGSIRVNSTVDKGSVFEICLPLGKSHFTEEELANDAVLPEPDSATPKPEQADWQLYEENHTGNKEVDVQTTQPQTTENEKKQYSILIVEDNEDLLELLKEAFSDKYTVYTAVNGKKGLEMTMELQPSIVLSDVMMPEMSGKEMCHKIKNNVNLAHIPVVLLTAQDSVDQTIEGYMFGAEDYVTKPFNMDLLITRCNSIIKHRQLLYRNVNNPANSVVSFDIQTQLDQEFIDKATQVIRNNFANFDFDMDVLASELCLGRNKLYTKVKNITGLTPNELTLNLKLQESLNLLRNYKHLNVSEIALQLGFSSSKYFSRCFKTFFGVTPMQWRKDNNQ